MCMKTSAPCSCGSSLQQPCHMCRRCQPAWRRPDTHCCLFALLVVASVVARVMRLWAFLLHLVSWCHLMQSLAVLIRPQELCRWGVTAS